MESYSSQAPYCTARAARGFQIVTICVVTLRSIISSWASCCCWFCFRGSSSVTRVVHQHYRNRKKEKKTEEPSWLLCSSSQVQVRTGLAASFASTAGLVSNVRNRYGGCYFCCRFRVFIILLAVIVCCCFCCCCCYSLWPFGLALFQVGTMFLLATSLHFFVHSPPPEREDIFVVTHCVHTIT